jgi:hypothetical protein
MKKFLILFAVSFVLPHLGYSQRLYDNGPLTGDENYVLQGSKWNKTTLNYYIYNTSSHLTLTQRESAINDAFQLWSDNSVLTFIQVSNPNQADLKIKWASGNHGDGYPFDGNSGVLAHAYYPPPAGGAYAGELHFDDDESWSLDDTGIDLITVAAHEIGHLLGLGHSNVTSALMYPYYFGINRNLDIDDQFAIWELYGYPLLISGSSTICTTPETYTLSAGAATSWSVAPASAFSVTASNDTSATVKALNYIGMQGTLTATVNGAAVTKLIQTCTSNVSISGLSSACSGATVTFTVTGAPAGYTWSNSSNLTLLSTSGNSASFRAGTATGKAWVGIQVAGVQVAQHNFSIAETPAGSITNYNGVYDCSGTYLFSASGVPSDISTLNVQWEMLPPVGLSTLHAGKNLIISFSVSGAHTLKMRYYGTCGYSPYATKTISVTGGLSLLSAYPNPASSILEIEIEEELQTMLQSSSSLSSSAGVYRVRLVSVQTGAVEYNQVLSSSSGNLSVNVSTIPDGLYNLTLTQGNTLLHSGTVLIQH